MAIATTAVECGGRLSKRRHRSFSLSRIRRDRRAALVDSLTFERVDESCGALSRAKVGAKTMRAIASTRFTPRGALSATRTSPGSVSVSVNASRVVWTCSLSTRCVARGRIGVDRGSFFGASLPSVGPRPASARARGVSVTMAGRKKLRGFVKKAGDAAEAALLETARLRAERTLIDGELREIREGRGEVVVDSGDMQMELLREIRALTLELRELKDEVRAAVRGGAFNSTATIEGSKPENAVKSDDEMMALLGGGLDGVDFGGALPEEADKAPLLDVTAWRGDGTDRSSEWPYVKQGEDDIYLMTTIHAKLNDAGFWCGEDDEDDMYFGESTKQALLYFQAQANIPETGLVEADTWRALLGDDAYFWGPVPGAISFDETQFVDEAAVETPAAPAQNPDHFMADEDYAPDDYDPFGHDEERGEAEAPRFQTTGTKSSHKWPVLREDDGGMEVHKMQVILSEKGYDSGEEDMEYWYFGSTTANALMTFQASERLRETGITDIDTWRALLGEERLSMAPADALATIDDGEYPNDLARTDKVFLLGEQRYEN